MDEKTKTHIAAQLPYLRRHARALTGSQVVGDELVKRALQRVLEEAMSASGSPTRVDLFRSLHNVLDPAAVPPGPLAPGPADATSSDALVQHRLEERVARLPPRWRAALLLVHAESMKRSEAAAVLGVTAEALSGLLEEAWAALRDEAPARVLIIEDEAVIALDIAGIVAEMGHAVVGVAARSDEAVRLARTSSPSLILADVQLEDGNTGIQTARRILETADLPVVFVTAFPERLLTGERVEPTFVVAKPFEPEALRVAVSQALFCAASG